MRKKMEEEIRAQLVNNQEMLKEAAGEGPSWEEKVRTSHIAHIWKNKILMVVLTSQVLFFLVKIT